MGKALMIEEQVFSKPFRSVKVTCNVPPISQGIIIIIIIIIINGS